MSSNLPEQLAATPLSGGNAAYLDSLYEQYLKDPAQLDPAWRRYFEQLPPAAAATGGAGTASAGASPGAAVSRLMQIYGNRGHLVAHIDPLGLLQRPRPRVLDLDYAGLGDADLDTEFFTATRNDWIPRRARLREIVARLEAVYCGHIGAEFAHVSDTDERL